MSDARQAKGLELAKANAIKKASGDLWIVRSQSHAGAYVVDLEAGTCTCPDHENRDVKCKHVWAVEYVRGRLTLV